jgi:hypothetical protein
LVKTRLRAYWRESTCKLPGLPQMIVLQKWRSSKT